MVPKGWKSFSEVVPSIFDPATAVIANITIRIAIALPLRMFDLPVDCTLRKVSAARASGFPFFHPDMADCLWLRRGWIDTLQRFGALLFQFRVRQGFAREHGIALRGVVDEDRHDHRRLLQVRFGETLVRVLIRVVAASRIVARVLDELKAGQAYLIERHVIG